MLNRLARYLPPECASPQRLLVRGIVLHHISASRDHPEDPYNPDYIFQIFVQYKVSAHVLILRDGTIWDLVPESRQAWHAGKSRFGELVGLNQYWLGAEFIGDVDHDFTAAQYLAGAELVAGWMDSYEIDTNRIKGHEQVSGPGVRDDYKKDPGPYFDWLRFGAHLHVFRQASGRRRT